jgi:hypothetical protein
MQNINELTLEVWSLKIRIRNTVNNMYLALIDKVHAVFIDVMEKLSLWTHEVSKSSLIR